MGMSLSMIPPCMVAVRALVWRLATLTPSTITLFWAGRTRMTMPSLPRSLPVSTRTRSPFLILRPAISCRLLPRRAGNIRRFAATARAFWVAVLPSQHLRCERDDAHEALVAQLPADGTEDAGPPGLLLVVDEHGRVLVEADVGAVRPPLLLLHPDDDALHDVALLHARARDRVLDGGDEDVPDRGVAAARATEHLDAEHLLRPAVVSHAQARLLLDHRARSITSVTRQRLSFDSGRVSWTRTRSPTLRSPGSWCA